MFNLSKLAHLIDRRNNIDNEIAALIGRPPHSGHIGEYVAAAIFGIDLHASAATKADDGRFTDGPLQGRSVNIKYGSRRDGMLNLVGSLNPADHPDVYLVLTGPTVGPISSRGLTAPWVIHAVYLFASKDLLQVLSARGRHPGIATSLRREVWEAAMLYPEPRNSLLQLTERQRADLSLFQDSGVPSSP
jgi:hypothetical protein